MSVTHGEQTARSVALEQAYVHEVYEQCAEKTAQTRHWPSIYKFLEELEPGALVCDIGCGDGKYLTANKNIFNVGGDRCKRLTDIAREKENEVLVCDNLSLPFRDESFDAVLSIAVIHHFATTERRVNALKELARVLRIGGKLVISVWAMEQHHRKFESQDVLVPWPKAYCLNSTCNGATSGMPCMKRIRDGNNSKGGCILRSKQSNRGKNRNKSYWNDPMYSSSPSTSSLSSPNETCYSFFRRALQKLAGGKRNSSNRPWFLDSFHSVSGGGGGVTGARSDSVSDAKNNRHHNCDQYDCGDVDDIPIELRRLEDEIVTLNKQTDSLSIKSKSLTDILEIQRSNLVRSRSSIPGLCTMLTANSNGNDKSLTAYKPRLVKQKTHLIDDTCLEVPEDTAIRELIKDLPEFQANAHQSLSTKRANVQKQSSMNEEFMSMERLVERESVRKNITKQASLSEDIMCKRRTFENLKDSLSSGNATRRFQLLKNGLTKRLQQSSMSMDKVSGISLKNGFVKILQGWKSSDSEPEYLDDKVSELIKNNINERTTVQMFDKKDCDTIERRLSREDGSDSSKDSSLQSDTSVDSEDSFASVIYVPKQEIPPLIDVPSGYQLRTTSAPPSPRIKHPPDLHGPRLKLISISPLLKQFPATSKSLPPPSPPGLSPRTINLYNSRPFFGPNYHINQHLNYTFDKLPSKPEAGSLNSDHIDAEEKPVSLLNTQKCLDVENVQEEIKEDIVKQEIEVKNSIKEVVDLTEDLNSTKKKPNLAVCRGYRSMSATVDQEDLPSIDDSVPLLLASEAPERFISESSGSGDESRKSRLNQIKELLKQKPGFATRTTRYSKSSFPLVRRASTASTGRHETAARTLPRLLSLELFNPETDDLDSDSSGVSSPESVGSVISVISDERFLLNRIAMTGVKPENQTSQVSKTEELSTTSVQSNEVVETKAEIKTTATTSSQSLRLLEAAASVASSLEDAVSRVIRVRSKSQDSHASDETTIDIKKSKVDDNVKNYLKETDKIKCEEKKWNDDCHKHLIDFTEKLGENLINDIDKYCKEKNIEFNSDNDLLMSQKNKGKNVSSHKRDCKYTQLVDNTIAWLKSSTGDNDFSEYDNKLIPLESQLGIDQVIKEDEVSLQVATSKSQDVDDSLDSIKIVGTEIEKSDDDDGKDSKSCLRFGGSVESSDIGDSTETTVSISDDSTNTRRFCSGSTVSLGSSNIGYKSLKEKRKHMHGKKSASEDTKNKRYGRMTSSNISGSSSQESLCSDRGGGAITYHQYYHVFREGELDQLINKYVENLHIISSYYDHASWCIVAEKVQVWTI